MAAFLTTKGISSAIEEIINNSQNELFILTPYLKFSDSLYDCLKYVSKREIVISFVYGKDELKKNEKERLYKLGCNIYFKDNLHAKCYANSSDAVVCSMNFHSFSEINNEEMGVLLNKVNDNEAYTKCINRINLIIGSAIAERIIPKDKKPVQEKNKILSKNFKDAWHERLRETYPYINFEMDGNRIIAKKFFHKMITFSDEHGFGVFKIENDFGVCKRLKEKYHSEIEQSLNKYRVYWNSPFDKILLYKSDKIEFKTIEDEVKYCISGLQTLISIIKALRY